MKVEMRTNVAGTPSYYTGQVVELEDRIATAWIKEGYAVPHRDGPATEKATKA